MEVSCRRNLEEVVNSIHCPTLETRLNRYATIVRCRLGEIFEVA